MKAAATDIPAPVPPPPALSLPRLAVRAGRAEPGQRTVPEEVAVAIVPDATTHAVLMATPADLEDLAVGFALTEGIVASPADIIGLDIVPGPDGIEARLWLAPGAGTAWQGRRRAILGASACGLCGVDSLAQALHPPPRVPAGGSFTAAEVSTAVAALAAAQPLGRATRAVHAAGHWSRDGAMVAREDVGRHNALDKLAGSLARAATPADGIVALTSRVSVEMVQKAAAIGARVLAAVSAPTALAVRTADAAGITLVAVARADGFEIFTHPERIA